MVMPEEAYTLWVHKPEKVMEEPAHRFLRGGGFTNPETVKQLLDELAEQSGVGVNKLHWRIGRHNDVHVFGSKEEWVSAKEEGKYFRKLKLAPNEFVEEVLKLVQ